MNAEPTSPSAELRSALYTLGSNLKLPNGTFTATLADLIRHRVSYRQSVVKALASRNAKLIEAFLPSKKGVIQAADLFRAQWNIVTRAERPKLYELFDHPLGEIERARRAISEGGAGLLKEASGGEVTPAMVVADLRGAKRILEECRDTLAQPRDFASNAVAVIGELALRFTRAADLLAAAAEFGVVVPKWQLRMSPKEQEVWAALEGKCMQGIALAKLTSTSVNGLQQSIDGIRKRSGDAKVIGNRPRFGYFRPDAPPDWGSVVAKRRHRIRPS